MLHGGVVSMKKLTIEITGIAVDEYAAEIEDGDGAMGCHGAILAGLFALTG
jgi:hypothetical protein